jgi:hypothetical protein
MPSHFTISIKFIRWTGPRLFSHGNSAGERVSQNPTYGFNWATTFQPWIRQLYAGYSMRHGIVSIGPRLFSHGYKRDGGMDDPRSKVSIGPRLFSHGYSHHISAFTAIEKKPIFTNLLDLHLYLSGVGLVKEAFSICFDVSRTSQGFRHHPGA